MPKRIALFFDGTWNTPHDGAVSADGDADTNVCKMYDAVLPTGQDGVEQHKWYHKGVGTDHNWFDRVAGGTGGLGLSRIIQEGYAELAKVYEDGDDVFVFGFSRGAYSARSLVGLVRNAGLVRPEHLDKTEDAYRLYRARDSGPDTENAVFFRREFSRVIPIHCLGVWDTVGALGIPIQSFEWFNRELFDFHDTELSGIVRNAFQALAIDEHRATFAAAPWDPKVKPNQTIEQRWFAGAHANVGGGYPDAALSDITLAWMAERAGSCGLALDGTKLPNPAALDPAGAIRDSYGEFLGGAYRLLQPRHYRVLGACQFGEEGVHPSVCTRYGAGTAYRPRNATAEWVRDCPWSRAPSA